MAAVAAAAVVSLSRMGMWKCVLRKMGEAKRSETSAIARITRRHPPTVICGGQREGDILDDVNKIYYNV